MKFKIGDKVRVIDNPKVCYTHEQRNLIGKIGEVIYTIYQDYTSYSMCDVTFNNGTSKLFYNTKLELVEEEKKMTNANFTIAGNALTVYIQGSGSWTITRDNVNWDKIVEELKKDVHDIDKLLQLLDIRKSVETYAKGNIRIENEQVFYKDEPINGVIVNRILSFMREGLPFKPLLNFLDNLMQNPSYRSREQLYQFLEKFSAPITSDGYFIAFKRVSSDFKDIHSGKFDNSPGAIVKMDRTKVDDDPSRTCSAGLHACASNYLDQFANANYSKTVTVKINPRDVVSIPTDYNFSKMRVCEYQVLEEIDPSTIKQIEEQDYYDYGAGLDVGTDWDNEEEEEEEEDFTIDDLTYDMWVEYDGDDYQVRDWDSFDEVVTIRDNKGFFKEVPFSELKVL